MRLNGGLLCHSDSEWLEANRKALAEFEKELEDNLKELRKKSTRVNLFPNFFYFFLLFNKFPHNFTLFIYT